MSKVIFLASAGLSAESDIKTFGIIKVYGVIMILWKSVPSDDSEHYALAKILDDFKWQIPLDQPLILGYYPSILVVKTRIITEETSNKKGFYDSKK